MSAEPENPSLRIGAIHTACRVLGPGVRFVVWVQGCPLRCPSCVSPQWLPFTGGTERSVEQLAERVHATNGIAGLTFSGGEPFAQAKGLVALVRAVRAHRDLSVMSYTGFTLEWLLQQGDTWQRRLLEACDILIDGPYIAGLHADLRWRGSSNQRLWLLSERHRNLAGDPDRSAGLQLDLDVANGLVWSGVPSTPAFARRFESVLVHANVVTKGGRR